jgi:pimeloyl-ACP methyl ester carboxylesterase
LTNNLKIPSNYVLGHSESGTIGLLYTSRKPKGLLGLIMLSSNVFIEPKISKAIHEVAKKYSKLKASLARHYHPNSDHVFRAWSEIRTSEMFQKFDIKNYIVWIEKPILAIHGINDYYTGLNQIYLLKACVKGFVKTVIWITVGTILMLNKRKKFLRISENFYLM